MANDVLVYNGTAVTTAYAASVAAGSAGQTAAVDFGTPRAATWLVELSAQMSAAPVAGTVIDVYVGYSSLSSSGFPGGLASASSAYAYAGYGQLEYVGSLVLTAVSTAEKGQIGVILPKLQYGCVVLKNGSAQTLLSNPAPTVTFTPIEDQIQ